MDGSGRGGIQDGRIVISTVQVEEYLLLAFMIKAHIVHFVFCLFLPPVRQNESNDVGKYYDKQCLLHNHSFLYVYYKNLRKNIIKNITKRIKLHPHARFDISLSKLDNSVAFFSIYYLHKGFGKKSCDALQSVAIDSVSLYRYEE